jgi:hypothetical protein
VLVIRVAMFTCVVSLAFVAASGSATVAPNVRGTIVGMTGGAAPICPSGEPCDPPQTRAFVLFSRPSRPTITIPVSGGSFALHLAPGAWSIHVAPSGQGGSLRPTAVRVPVRGVVHLRLVVQQKAVAQPTA